MDNKQVNKAPQKSARLVLQAVTAIARSNANLNITVRRSRQSGVARATCPD